MNVLPDPLRNFPGRLVEHEGRYLPDTGPSSAGWHELSEFVLCPQRWAYGKLLGIDAGRKDYFDRGSAYHAGVGAAWSHLWAKDKPQAAALLWSPGEAVDLVCDSLGQPDMKQPVRLTVEAYVEHVLNPEAGRWNVLGVELEAEAVVQTRHGPRKITRGIDLVRQDRRTGAVEIVDHKSRSGTIRRIERAYEHDLTLDYLWKWGQGTYGAAFGGVVLSYGTVPKSAAREAKVEFQEVRPKRSPWREAALADTVRHYSEQLTDLINRDIDPWHWPKAQTGFGPCPTCPFLDYCRFGPPRTVK